MRRMPVLRPLVVKRITGAPKIVPPTFPFESRNKLMLVASMKRTARRPVRSENGVGAGLPSRSTTRGTLGRRLAGCMHERGEVAAVSAAMELALLSLHHNSNLEGFGTEQVNQLELREELPDPAAALSTAADAADS